MLVCIWDGMTQQWNVSEGFQVSQKEKCLSVIRGPTNPGLPVTFGLKTELFLSGETGRHGGSSPCSSKRWWFLRKPRACQACGYCSSFYFRPDSLACLISAICSGKPFAGEGVGLLQKAVHTQIAISLLSSFTSFGWPPKRG